MPAIVWDGSKRWVGVKVGNDPEMSPRHAAVSVPYALVANEWIRVINANGGSLPEVDLAPFLGVAARSHDDPRTRLPEFSREAYETLLAFFPTLGARRD